MPLVLTITNEQKIPVMSTPKTESGKPAAVDGPLRVTVISGEGSFTQDPGVPNTVMLVSGDNPGDTTYLIEVDADVTPDQPDGSGVQLIQDTVLLSVMGARAVNLGLSAGPAEPK